MGLDLVNFQRLAGVPVVWSSWGNFGERKLARPFLPVLEAVLADLWAHCPWGPPAEILSGGAYVDRPQLLGDRHAVGTAFDLSGLDWRPTGGPRLRLGQAAKRSQARLLLACEAILRRTLPQVLGPWYDADHVSHWHVDDREDVRGFQPSSRADVQFVQAALTHVHGHGMPIDGAAGPVTWEGIHDVLDDLDAPTTILDPAGWDAWLVATALVGFGRVEAG